MLPAACFLLIFASHEAASDPCLDPLLIIDVEPGAPLGLPPRKGRGALANPTGRFERFQVEPDLEDRPRRAAEPNSSPTLRAAR